MTWNPKGLIIAVIASVAKSQITNASQQEILIDALTAAIADLKFFSRTPIDKYAKTFTSLDKGTQAMQRTS